MDKEVFSFNKIKIDHSFLDQVWEFSPNKLGSFSNEQISKFAVALSQYLIYFKSEQNKARAEITKKKRFLESAVALSSDDKTLKKYKTKSALMEYMVNTNPDLNKISNDIDMLNLELIKMEGMDKVVGEYITTLKKELSRREQELYTIRSERRSNGR